MTPPRCTRRYGRGGLNVLAECLEKSIKIEGPWVVTFAGGSGGAGCISPPPGPKGTGKVKYFRRNILEKK